MRNREEIKYLVGIDEAGRGPLAGPVSVGVFLIKKENEKILKKDLQKARDSKKMSAKQRGRIFEDMKKLKKKGVIDFAVSFLSSSTIDHLGISKAVEKGIKHGLIKLKAKPSETRVLLDGLLKAPRNFKNQKTIIHGDDKEKIISCASIVAKVLRDKKMIHFAKKYPKYDFNIHKGYGTRRHIALIKKFGVSPIHRKSFLKNISF